MTDPWKVQGGVEILENRIENEQEIENIRDKIGFEDDFSPSKETQNDELEIKLPDSEQYLESLERKLNRIKRDPNILQQLTEKREECLRNLLNENITLNRDEVLAFEAPIPSTIGNSQVDTTVQEIYRHIRPVQPLTVGEIVHIVKYDQLEEEQQKTEDENSSVESEPASR